MAQQLKHLLMQVTWPGGSVVFGSEVFVYAGTQPDESALPAGFPFALVTINEGRPDPDDPDLILQDFTIVSVVNVAGDPLGEHAVIGGSLADDGKSEGRGSAEIAERVRSAVQRLTGFDGAPLIVSGTAATAPATTSRGRHIVAEQFTVTALCTSQPFQTPPQLMQLTGDTFSWFGDQCAARFDFLQFRIGWVTGLSPAASAADFEGVAFTGTSNFGVPSGGPLPGRTYSVVADYTPRDRATAEASSDPDVVGCFFTT
jgi:hypothetical protein